MFSLMKPDIKLSKPIFLHGIANLVAGTSWAGLLTTIIQPTSFSFLIPVSFLLAGVVCLFIGWRRPQS